MELDRFDALTRQWGADGSTRRLALHTLGSMLLGGALAGVAARLGVTEDAAAKAKKHAKKAHAKHPRQMQAAGKKRNKHKKKHHDKPKELPPLPPGCENCAECQMCQDGACVPDPDLERVFCAKSGFACSYCQQGVCTFFQEGCDDGTCPQKGYCCQGEKFCPSIESPTGFFCINGDACCDGQKKCGDQCVSVSSQCECREGWVDCGEHQCQCYVGDGVRQCMGGTVCCPPSKYCAATMECCFGGLQCTPEGCCDYLWIVDGHCRPPQH